MKKIILPLTIVIVSLNCSFSQNQSYGIKKNKSSNDLIRALKDISLCSCLINGFPTDSLDTKDHSIYVLLETNKIGYEVLDTINNYTMKYITSLPKTRKGQNRESTQKKRIMTGCISLYNSMSLEAFLTRYYIAHKGFFSH